MLATAGEGDGQEVLQAKATGFGRRSRRADPHRQGGGGRRTPARRGSGLPERLPQCRRAEGGRRASAGGRHVPARSPLRDCGAFGAPRSGELLQRAERLYSASLEGYRARYGEEHEKSRFAREGLTTVQLTGGKSPAVIAKAAPAAPAPGNQVGAVAPAPVRQPQRRQPPRYRPRRPRGKLPPRHPLVRLPPIRRRPL